MNRKGVSVYLLILLHRFRIQILSKVLSWVKFCLGVISSVLVWLLPVLQNRLAWLIQTRGINWTTFCVLQAAQGIGKLLSAQILYFITWITLPWASLYIKRKWRGCKVSLLFIYCEHFSKYVSTLLFFPFQSN